MRVGEQLLVVTLAGECFEARLKHKEYNPARSSLATFWVLEDKVWERPNLRVAAFLPDETCCELEGRSSLDHDLVGLNGVRRAFDWGELRFEDDVSERVLQREVIVSPNAPALSQNFVVDARVRSLILHRAYWEGFKYSPSSSHSLDFATDRDLDYLGVDRNAIQRNVWLLSKYGHLELDPAEATRASPTPKLVESYASGGAIAGGIIRIFPVDSQQESWNEIARIVKSAKSTLTVVDNYVDESILDMLKVVSGQVRVRVLSEHLPSNFGNAVEAFLMQHNGATVEVRAHVKKIHDRFIIVDQGSAYSLGASIKDAGKRLWHLHRLDDRLQLAKLKNLLGAEWDSAAPVWPPP